MELADRLICTGCGACEKACPKQAISFVLDKEGFPAPEILKEKCIDCGKCAAVCPALHAPKENAIREAYAAQIKDRDALIQSSSGGLFTALSREIFRRGGVVYGCVWDDQYNAVVRKAENEDEMLPMRGSKYVWSEAKEAYPEIREFLKAGKTVLFTGLPCQAAGLKNYLGKDYENLYLVTFFCGGAPSPLAFREYLKTITRSVPLDKLGFLFRDKRDYGVGVHISYQGKKKRVRETFVDNPYFYCYHRKLVHRPSCFQCPYRYKDRVEDLTIGDYWGVANYHGEFDVKAGVSALLVNSEKGKALFDAIRDQLQLVPAKPEQIARANNLTLEDQEVRFSPPNYRDAFFTLLRAKGWNAAKRKYLFDKTRIKLLLKQRMPKDLVRKINRFRMKRSVGK